MRQRGRISHCDSLLEAQWGIATQQQLWLWSTTTQTHSADLDTQWPACCCHPLHHWEVLRQKPHYKWQKCEFFPPVVLLCTGKHFQESFSLSNTPQKEKKQRGGVAGLGFLPGVWYVHLLETSLMLYIMSIFPEEMCFAQEKANAGNQ